MALLPPLLIESDACPALAVYPEIREQDKPFGAGCAGSPIHHYLLRFPSDVLARPAQGFWVLRHSPRQGTGDAPFLFADVPGLPFSVDSERRSLLRVDPLAEEAKRTCRSIEDHDFSASLYLIQREDIYSKSSTERESHCAIPNTLSRVFYRFVSPFFHF